MRRRVTKAAVLTAATCAIAVVSSCRSGSDSRADAEAGPADAAAALDAPDDAHLLYTGPRSPCSTGPAYPPRATFPVDDACNYGECGPPQPACIPRCDYDGTKYEEAWPNADALPNGACLYDGELCDMGAWDDCGRCNGFVDVGALSEYRCRCASGSWHCVILAQGGGSCPDCLED